MPSVVVPLESLCCYFAFPTEDVQKVLSKELLFQN